MERGKAEDDTTREPTDEEARLDIADYENLARLVAEHPPVQNVRPIDARSIAAVNVQPQLSASSQQAKSRSRLILLGAAFVALAIGMVIYSLVKFGSSARRASDTKQTNNPIRPRPALKSEMVAIPGGTFQMGRDDGLLPERPAHAVTVAPFYMDNTEVTNSEYADFVRQTNHASPEHWGKPLEQGASVKPSEIQSDVSVTALPPVGQELLPVSNVSYEDAVAFALWRSTRDGVKYRLPAEEEWEYAARNGDEDSLYPWGNTWPSGRAATQEAGKGEQPVGTYPQGANRWGVQDLIGNVWEWTSSRASYYPGSTLTLPEAMKGWIVARGGSYSSSANKVSATMRDWFAPNYKHPALGFRLVRDAR